MFQEDSKDILRHLTTNNVAADRLTTPGQVITTDPAFMRGHGTYVIGDKVLSSVCGTIERVNKLISIQPLRSRYNPEIGDSVIGRITEVASKRWKVDIGSRQDAILMLSSINLPGGVQRRKSESDELAMRTFFKEGDLVVAEVQAFFADGAVSLHTRSLRYGKLRNGCLITVGPYLIQRLKSHFHSLAFGIDIILGLNGYIWISKHEITSITDLDPLEIYSDINTDISLNERENIARVYACIGALSEYQVLLNDTVINLAFEASQNWENLCDLTSKNVKEEIVLSALGEV